MKKNWCLLVMLAIILALLQQVATYLPFAGVMPAPFAPVLNAPLPVPSPAAFLPF